MELLSRSAPQYAGFRTSAPLPSDALEFRPVALGLRGAQAKISDEAPGLRDIENIIHARRIENRNPPHADVLGARRQPHHRYRRDSGIFGRFRHRPASQTVSNAGSAVRKYGELARRFLKPCEFE